ncbi:MAG: flippase-like domain-containing protein [Sedimentisphaerales bacterium]|nr:flippase-like domain-containing protein [Sedimentisphaerales bacterium]
MSLIKARRNRYIFLFVRIAVVACGIIWGVYWLSQGQRWPNLTKIFRQMNPWIFVAATGIFAIGNIFAAFRWWLLLMTQSIFIGFWTAVRLFFLGWFYNNFMPSSVGGDLVRAWYVTKHTDKKFEAALSVFVDRGIGMVGTVVIAAFYYLFFFRQQAGPVGFNAPGSFLKSIAEYKTVVFWLLVVVAVIFLVFLSHARGRMVLGKTWLHIRVHGLKMIEKLKTAAVIYCSRPMTILVAFVLTILMQIMVITGFWFLGVNLGADVSIKYYFLFFTFIWLVGVLPVSIGGAVVMEGGLAYLFVRFAAVGPEAALALALCQRIIWMLTSLPGAAIHLSGTHLPKDFSIDCDKSIN